MAFYGFVKNKYFVEKITDDLVHASTLEEVHCLETSKYQKIDIFTLGSFGTCLVLDGCIQSSVTDEFIYHETLVHPAMIAHKNPKSVFIGGGGEGATAREVLRHKSVEKCVMVDLDEAVVKLSEKYMPSYSNGCFQDKRFKVVFDDCKVYLEKNEDKYDIIIFDLCDPIENNPCYQLYTKEFYKFCLTRLNEGGYIVTQSGPGGYRTCDQVFTAINCTFKQVFKYVYPFSVNVPFFLDDYGFYIGTNDGYDIKKLTDEEIDKRIVERTGGTLLHYDSESHRNAFSLRKEVRTKIEKETRVISNDQYVFLQGKNT